MQAAMDRLDGFTRRHGKLVALAWLLLLIAALPFTARQTEHLTSGGARAGNLEAAALSMVQPPTKTARRRNSCCSSAVSRW